VRDVFESWGDLVRLVLDIVVTLFVVGALLNLLWR
jgi:hypothetical protein